MTLARAERWYVATMLLLTAGFVFNFSGYPLLDPDEGRNAEVMREMAAANEYAVPRLNGLPYVDKPILYFAVGALGMEALGPTVLAARLPSLLFSLATVMLVAWFAARLWGREGAWIAALATASTPFALAYSRTVIFDAAVMFWVAAAIVSWYLALEAEEAPWWRLAAWGALALGVLTKGPVVLVVPLLIIVPYALWRRRARALVDLTSVLLFVALILPWVFAMSADVPGYLRYVLVTETVGRLTTTELGREGPWWYFLVILPAAALPWSVVALAEAVRARRLRGLDPRTKLLLSWIVVPLLFFTLSQSKRPQYILPLVPAFGLTVAQVWTAEGAFRRSRRSAAIAVAALGAFLITTAHVIPDWVSGSREIAAAVPATAVVLGLVCILAGFAAFFATQRHVAVLALVLPVAAIPFVSVRLMDAIGTYRSAEPLASAIRRVAGEQTNIVAVQTFPLSLPFYMRRTLTLATDDASELTSNYLVRHASYWMRRADSPLRPAGWWREVLLECPRPAVFVAASSDQERRRALAERLDLIADTGRHAAYGPCGRVDLASRPLAPHPLTPSPARRERGDDGPASRH